MKIIQFLFVLSLVYQVSKAIVSKNHLVSKQTLKSCSIYTISNVNWPNVYIRMEQNQNNLQIVDLHNTKTTDKNDQWKVSNYTANNKFGYYLCLNNVAQGYYLSLGTSGCSKSQTDSGCGTFGISANCYGNEQFVFQPVSNGHYALISVANPNYIVRTDGNHIVIYTVTQPNPNVYSAGAKIPQQQGGGVINLQYYGDYHTASSWESYDFHLVSNSC